MTSNQHQLYKASAIEKELITFVWLWYLSFRGKLGFDYSMFFVVYQCNVVISMYR